MFYLYYTSCNPGFLFKCFKFSLCWRSLYLSLLFDKDISRGMRAFGRLKGLVKGKWGQWQAACNRQLLNLSCFMFTVNEEGMERGLSTSHRNHLLDTENEHQYHSLSFSLYLFPSLYGCQTMLSSEGWTWTAAVALCCVWWHCTAPRPLSGQWRSPLRQRLESPTCLKCTQMQFDLSSGLRSSFSSESHRSPFHSVHYTLPDGKRYLLSDVFVWFCPALVSDCCLVCSANISYSACGSFSITFCCVKTNNVFQKNADWERGLFFVEQKNSAVYCNVVGWKDIANILTNYLFSWLFFCRWMLCVTVHQVVSWLDNIYFCMWDHQLCEHISETVLRQKAQVLHRLLYFVWRWIWG